MTDVEKAQQAWQAAFIAAGEARNACSRAVRDRPAYGTAKYDEYQATVMTPLLAARNVAMAAERQAKNALAEARKAAAVAGTFQITRNEQGVKTMTKLEDGKSINAWDRVTVGKSKAVWDVTENMYSASGKVELHRQIPTSSPRQRGVTYRMFHFNQLTVVSEES
jgi:hypothetical protein